MHNIEWYNTLKSEINDYCNSLPKDLISIFMSLRDTLLINLPFITESLIEDVPTYKFGNRKVFYILCYSNRVVLGFYQGAKIFDKFGLFSEFTYRNIKEIDFYSINETYNSNYISYLQETMKLVSSQSRKFELLVS